MIVQYIISAFFFLVNGFLTIIPATPELPAGLISAITSVFGYISTIGYFVPLTTLSSVLLICFAMYNIKFLMDFLAWVLRKIPTMGG